MSEAYRTAIEAGKRALDESYKHGRATDEKVVANILAAMLPHAIPERCDDELYKLFYEAYEQRKVRLLASIASIKESHRDGVDVVLAHLRARMTPPAKPGLPVPDAHLKVATPKDMMARAANERAKPDAWGPPKPPADDERVERVARAILEAAGLWPERWQKWELEARAAIAAMGGKRWGVWITYITGQEKWFQTPDEHGFSTTDYTAASSVADAVRGWQSVRASEVREYVEQAKGKTAEEIAGDIASAYRSVMSPQAAKDLQDQITAAIENARKGANCGNP
jgi:hypothetical protein